jgi:hypothetical protein
MPLSRLISRVQTHFVFWHDYVVPLHRTQRRHFPKEKKSTNMKIKFTSLILAYLIQTLEARLTDKDMSVDEARNLVSYSNSRIIGGTVSSIGRYSYAVSLQGKNKI